MARRFLIDRTELPYDAMVSDPRQLIPIDDDDDGGEPVGETERLQTDKVHE